MKNKKIILVLVLILGTISYGFINKNIIKSKSIDSIKSTTLTVSP